MGKITGKVVGQMSFKCIILYEKLFNLKNFWQSSLLRSIIFISNIKEFLL